MQTWVSSKSKIYSNSALSKDFTHASLNEAQRLLANRSQMFLIPGIIETRLLLGSGILRPTEPMMYVLLLALTFLLWIVLFPNQSGSWILQVITSWYKWFTNNSFIRIPFTIRPLPATIQFYISFTVYALLSYCQVVCCLLLYDINSPLTTYYSIAYGCHSKSFTLIYQSFIFHFKLYQLRYSVHAVKQFHKPFLLIFKYHSVQISGLIAK